jgi:hypothetical protein
MTMATSSTSSSRADARIVGCRTRTRTSSPATVTGTSMARILAHTAPSLEGAREKNANRHGAALGAVTFIFRAFFAGRIGARVQRCATTGVGGKLGTPLPLQGSTVSTSHAHTIPLLSLGIAQRLASTALPTTEYSSADSSEDLAGPISEEGQIWTALTAVRQRG